MLQTRQEPAATEALVARLARPQMMWHALFVFAGLGFSVTQVVPTGPARVAALVALGLIGVAFGLTLRRLVLRMRLVVGRDGLTLPGGDLLVPWSDVVSVEQVDRGLPGPALRLELRDGPGLLVRQAPGASIPRGQRVQLERGNTLDCPLRGWDRTPGEIVRAAEARACVAAA